MPGGQSPSRRQRPPSGLIAVRHDDSSISSSTRRTSVRGTTIPGEAVSAAYRRAPTRVNAPCGRRRGDYDRAPVRPSWSPTLRYSRMLIATRRQAPGDAVVVSHVLMERTSMIRKVAAGIYNYYPLMVRAMRKVEQIVREEMNRAGAQEILMPAVQPAALWKQSGRWEKYGPELLRFKDRKQNDFVIGPTHEEVVSAIVAQEVESYRRLPLNLYQIQTKFRDEIRPRFGLMRGREFVMKDAYSFDVDEAGALKSYDAMYEAYRRIFRRCGLDFRPVEADTGNIGGNRSHEFHVLADSGEDEIMACDHCDYAANVEKAETSAGAAAPAEAAGAPEIIDTPGIKACADVAAFLGVPVESTIKTMVYFDETGRFYAACVRGDHEVNPIKLKTALGGLTVYPAEDKHLAQLGLEAGSIGPAGLPAGLEVIADPEVAAVADPVVGANQPDRHTRRVYAGRDYTCRFADIRQARAGDVCARCRTGRYVSRRGIEVGHVFYLGTKYATAMNVEFLDEQKLKRHAVMGCYGIGITRTVAAAIEQNHDENGLIWPLPIAPFQVVISPVIYEGAVQTAVDALYAELTAAGVEVLLDDRDERPGVKFKDADLLGIPLRVTIGEKGLANGEVEFKPRRAARAEPVPVGEAAARVRAWLADEAAKYAP